MQLTEHFMLEQFTRSDLATRLGIDNRPNAAQLKNIQFAAEQAEVCRRVLRAPIFISSGFRCPALNKAAGGSLTSAHMDGRAIDFRADSFGNPLAVAEALAAFVEMGGGLPYDQIIHEFGRWVHIGFAKPDEAPRGELLTAYRKAKRVVYVTGLRPVGV